MATIVQHKRSETAGSEPATGDLTVGELAINLADAKLYSKKTDGTIVTLAGNVTATTYYLPNDMGEIDDAAGLSTDFGSITSSVSGGNTQETNTTSNVTFNNVTTTGTITPGAYTAGQVIKDTMLDNTQFTVNTTTVATSTSDTDFITYNYTPVSSSSYLIIHVHVANYDAGIVNGSGDDSYYSRIKVDGTEIVYSRQATKNNYTFRSGTLFPLTGRYTNSNKNAKTITVGVRRDSADDYITIANSGTALWMRITEVAR